MKSKEEEVYPLVYFSCGNDIGGVYVAIEVGISKFILPIYILYVSHSVQSVFKGYYIPVLYTYVTNICSASFPNIEKTVAVLA